MGKKAAKNPGKYQPRILIQMFRLAAALRNKMIKADFSDNGGAIHSAERIINILGQRLNYPGLSHLNNLRHRDDAEFSIKARAAYKKGEKVTIEHVAPIRAFTSKAIEKVRSKSDVPLRRFVKKHFQLVLLTPAEAIQLNRINRTKIDANRLRKAGIKLAPKGTCKPRKLA